MAQSYQIVSISPPEMLNYHKTPKKSSNIQITKARNQRTLPILAQEGGPLSKDSDCQPSE